ncbi:MAG: DNA-processing protein DprA [Pseudonocardia sp.]
MITEQQRRLLTLCAMRVTSAGLDWQVIARIAQSHRGLDLLFDGEIPESSRAAADMLPVLRQALADNHRSLAEERVDREVTAAARVGASLVTVLDDDYPANLRLIPNLPPFLFVLGGLSITDARAVAVVGTRQASQVGVGRAESMARQLVEHGVTVTSGLARGIDTAAHTAALARGGRTVAVIGTGVTRCYPAENKDLAAAIAERGAVVSQFWPTAPPAKHTFPRRNVVMSGISQGTVVIEASKTSGAKMQARIAADHGKQVFVLRSLMTEQEWAQKMVDRGTAVEVKSVDDVIGRLAAPERVQAVGSHRQQLALELL